MAAADEDNSVRAVAVTGAGQAFCADARVDSCNVLRDSNDAIERFAAGADESCSF
jgi:enoyl-CoA hydratase/carnithine racemase